MRQVILMALVLIPLVIVLGTLVWHGVSSWMDKKAWRRHSTFEARQAQITRSRKF